MVIFDKINLKKLKKEEKINKHLILNLISELNKQTDYPYISFGSNNLSAMILTSLSVRLSISISS